MKTIVSKTEWWGKMCVRDQIGLLVIKGYGNWKIKDVGKRVRAINLGEKEGFQRIVNFVGFEE